MKKLLSIIFVLFIFLLSNIFAKNNSVSISFEPLFGLRSGCFTEYVYDNNSVTNEEYHLSLLDWKIKNVPYLGASIDYSSEKFIIAFNYKKFFLGDFGTMEDSDWTQDYGYSTGNSLLKTNFSEHDIELINGMNLNLDLRRIINLSEFIIIMPSIGLSLEKYSFDGNDGYFMYGINLSGYESSYYPYNDPVNSKKGVFNGKVISLERIDFYTWMGVDLLLKSPSKRFSVYLSAAISPYTYLYAFDSHYLRGLYFRDTSTGSFSAYKGTISLQFNLNNFLGIKFEVNGLFTKEIKGTEEVSQVSPDYGYVYAGEGIGAATKYFDMQLSCVMKF